MPTPSALDHELVGLPLMGQAGLRCVETAGQYPPSLTGTMRRSAAGRRRATGVWDARLRVVGAMMRSREGGVRHAPRNVMAVLMVGAFLAGLAVVGRRLVLPLAIAAPSADEGDLIDSVV